MKHLKALFISEHLVQDLLASVFISVGCYLFGASAPTSFYIFIVLLIGQFSIDISNNYFDRHADKISGQKNKVIADGTVPAELAIQTALVLLSSSIALSLFIPQNAGYIHIIALGIAWAYNLGIKKTPYSILCYMIAFSLTPIFIANVTSRDTTLFVIAAFAIFGALSHFIESLKDYDYDKKVGNRAFPTLFPKPTSRKILNVIVVLQLATILLAILNA